MSENAFSTIADSYKRGEMDNNLDLATQFAASNGIVLLPGDDRPTVPAINGCYEVSDLLLPVDLDTWHTLTEAYKAGIPIFPEWFTYNPEKGYAEYSEEDLCRAFIQSKKLTRHKGAFLENGKPIADSEIKVALFRSLAIIRKNAAGYAAKAFAALKILCHDDTADAKQERLSIAETESNLLARGYKVRLNAISTEYEVTGSEIGSLDDLVTMMHDTLSDDYKGVSFEILERYITYIARKEQYNPVLELLSSTEWDGIDRLPQLYALMGITEDALSKTLVRKWLYQAIALLFNDPADPFGADGCLVLNGSQGAGKTSLFRHLAMRDAWFGEGCCIDDRDKDTTRRVITKWISELGEVESTLKSDISKLKAFVSASMDRYRLPYGKADVIAPRITSLCATCNSDRYLIDPTGNRRWWSIPFNRTVPRIELLRLNALQLWAQIYAIINPLPYIDKSSCFRLSDDEQKALAARNGQYEKPVKGQNEVEDILLQAEQKGIDKEKMTISEFKAQWNVLRPYSAQQISAALKACGVELIRTKIGSCAELPCNSPF